jgi:hypothetical protein
MDRTTLLARFLDDEAPLRDMVTRLQVRARVSVCQAI